MSFISQGDFMFPFDFTFYWIKHLFVWSYQTGAANPDGIIRIPGRLLYFLLFDLTDNISISYIYLAISMLVIFVSFYVFAKHFLNIKDKRISLVAAGFFAFNPIFLGYLAKVGLLVGVAMLPLCLTTIKYAFLKQQHRYLVLLLLLLNISLIHPFTFTVNLVVSATYFLILFFRDNKLITRHKPKTAGLVLLGLLLNAYFIMPIAALGTVSKNVISQEISGTPVDYAALIDFANTGDPLTALSLSKNVFLDFEYYNWLYEPVYFAAAFGFLGLLFGLYLYNEKSMGKKVRGNIALLFALFLGLLLLSMATFIEVNRLIKFMIGLPGGWMFRSPLKWQLYIPFILAAIMSLLLVHSPKKIKKGTLLGFVVTAVLMSGFLTYDIFRKLLIPRQFEQLAQMEQLDLDQKNMLFVNDGRCFSFLQENPELVTEFNQLLISRNVQLKRAKSAGIDSVNLDSFDYVMGCRSTLAFPMGEKSGFQKKYSFAGDVLDLYENKNPRPYMYTLDKPYLLATPDNLSGKAAFADNQGRDFDFVTDGSGLPAIGLEDPFESIEQKNIQDDKIITQALPTQNDIPVLHATGDETTYFARDDKTITLSGQKFSGSVVLPEQLPLQQLSGKSITTVYIDQQRDRRNLIPNPSFEEGLWQENVWDCYAYDDKPAVNMSLNNEDSAAGRQSLELSAKRHIACSGPGKIAVKQDSRYLLDFAYKSIGGSFAGYRVTFDDEHKTTTSDYLPPKEGEWIKFSQEIEVPPGATQLELVVYGRQGVAGTEGTARYDDFSLQEIPDLQGKIYITGQNTTSSTPQIAFTHQDPTKKQLRISGARDGFYLAMKDTYHPGWKLHTQGSGWLPSVNSAVSTSHTKANGFMNMWYIDSAKLCETNPQNCQQNADGTYNLELYAEFVPQRWLYAGLVVSGLAYAGIASYFIYLGIRFYRQGAGRLWRHR